MSLLRPLVSSFLVDSMKTAVGGRIDELTETLFDNSEFPFPCSVNSVIALPEKVLIQSLAKLSKPAKISEKGLVGPIVDKQILQFLIVMTG